MDAETAMLWLTGGSLVVAIIAGVIAVLAKRDSGKAAKAAEQANEIALDSNRIAEAASRDARDAPLAVAWDEMIAAVAAVQTYDAAEPDEPARPLLTALRTRAQLLVDRLDWPGFDEWVARELRLGVLLMREAMERGRKSAPLSADQAIAISRDFHLWVVALTNNLRLFRRTGLDAEALTRLIEIAREKAETVSDRNGWPQPEDTIPGLTTLDDDPE